MIVKKTLATQWQAKLGRDYFVEDGYKNVCIYKLIRRRFIIWHWYEYDFIECLTTIDNNVDFTQTITTKNREFAEHCDKLGLNVVLEV